MSRAHTIACAELKPVRVGKQCASDRVQRALLQAIARHDGEPVPSYTLKAESGLGERCVWLAIQALEHAGLIRVTPGKPNTYHIQWDRLSPGGRAFQPAAASPEAVPA